jgi:hypothetical protein
VICFYHFFFGDVGRHHEDLFGFFLTAITACKSRRTHLKRDELRDERVKKDAIKE